MCKRRLEALLCSKRSAKFCKVLIKFSTRFIGDMIVKTIVSHTYS